MFVHIQYIIAHIYILTLYIPTLIHYTESWFDDRGDDELLKALSFLSELTPGKDVRPIITEHFRTQDLIEESRRSTSRYNHNNNTTTHTNTSTNTNTSSSTDRGK